MVPLAALLLLAGCGGSAEPAPGALTPDQERELNEAAAALDANAANAAEETR